MKVRYIYILMAVRGEKLTALQKCFVDENVLSHADSNLTNLVSKGFQISKIEN